MRKMLYIIVCAWLITSCANRKTEADTSDMVLAEESGLYELEGNETLVNFNYEDLATEKLQDYLDLYVLNKKHPEFELDITARLKNLSEKALEIPENEVLMELRNIRAKDEVEKISDSIQHIAFYFDKVTNQNTITDSIIAVIKTEEVMLDGNKMKSTKVTFKNFK